ncbi:MAG: cytochrome c peroxidase [Saprospiraceae bacterium]
MIKIYAIFSLLIAYTLISPAGDPTTRAELGEKLFFDPILSQDSSLSCASCHKPELAFADSVAISLGVDDAIGRRNAPSVMNMAFRSEFFYDGRATSLIDQVHFPIEDPKEMNLTIDVAVERLKNHSQYSIWFTKIFKEEPSVANLAMAIAAYEETLETADTEFDAWMGDYPNKMSEAAIRGRSLFMSDKAKCFDCHFSPDFTGDEFKNIGLYDEKTYKDKGRYEVTNKPQDLGKFKVPGLRNVAITAPYMHDGSFKTLESVIEYYSNPTQFVEKPINMDTTLLRPINFTSGEKSDLLEFLKSLTDRSFVKIQ